LLQNVPLDKLQFLDNRSIFLPKFQDLQRKEFSTILEIFTKIFSLLQELQLLQHFIPYFKIPKLRRRNGQSLVTVNVQRQ